MPKPLRIRSSRIDGSAFTCRRRAQPRRTVLILLDAGRGDLNLSHLFSRAHNSTVDWFIEYAPNGQAATLPPFDLVFNAMGDPDMAKAATLPASRFIAGCEKPVLNRPDVVSRTSREKLPALFQGIDGLVVPQVWRVAPEAAWPREIRDGLPVLVRPVESHGGEGLQRVASNLELDLAVAQCNAPLYVSRFFDFRSDDGWYRKYRVVFIDRQPLSVPPRDFSELARSLRDVRHGIARLEACGGAPIPRVSA